MAEAENTKLLIIGSNKQLSQDIADVFSDFQVHVLGGHDLNLHDHDKIVSYTVAMSPDWIINTESYDNPIEDTHDFQTLFSINTNLVHALTESAKITGSKLVHFSSSSVFSGTKNGPYNENDEPIPLGPMGASKLAAEQIAMKIRDSYILRLSVVFGSTGMQSGKHTDIIDLVYDLALNGQTIRISHNGVISPTFSLDVAKFLRKHLFCMEPGLYHLANSEPCTMYDFVREVLKQTGISTKTETDSSNLTIRIARNTSIASLKTKMLRPWKDALKESLSRSYHKEGL
jgi:dTDP-4-dehydrorhamnose reductase